MARIAGVALIVTLLTGCALGGRTPDGARQRADAALDETAQIVATGLTATTRWGPEQVAQCSPMPGWPTSKVRWVLGGTYPLPDTADPRDLVAKAVRHWEDEGAGVSFVREETDAASARLKVPGNREVFVSAIGASGGEPGMHVPPPWGTTGDRGLHIWVRSRCFAP